MPIGQVNQNPSVESLVAQRVF